MPSANYVLLEKITVGAAGASSVTFSSIPQTGYTDLVIKTSVRNTNASIANWYNINFNGVTTNRSRKSLYGDGSSTASYGSSDGEIGVLTGANATANTFGSHEIYITNYATSNFKSVSADSVTENNATNAAQLLTAVLWSDTSPITSITLSGVSNFVQYSTFYLYGVAKLGTTPAIVPYATGGDTIMTDGTYWIHTFLSSGTFTPQKSLSNVDYLVVAGGGGPGAGSVGGGGGAGGLRSTVTATGGGGSLESKLSLASGTSYTVTVGAGATGNTNGSNSVFSTITSIGGGLGSPGGANPGTPAQVGGSGGGGGSSSASTGASGTANQGYGGGNGIGSVSPYASGGGGGAGAAGANGTGSGGGAGGNGVTTSISGSSVTYAGGGGGGVAETAPNPGAGGTGGGGTGEIGLLNGNVGTSATNGTPNTGGGAGGGRVIATGTYSNGGSGIVIVRYPI